jgi:hypothetical protein
MDRHSDMGQLYIAGRQVIFSFPLFTAVRCDFSRAVSADLVQDLKMSSTDIAEARSFISVAELPPARPEVLGEETPGDASPFDAAKQQAAVVGSDVVSFVTEITPDQRQDIVNAALLAQLAANKKVPDPQGLKGIEEWYKTYFDVMARIGFVVQDHGFAQYTEKADTFEAHEAIIDVVTAALVGAPAALPLVLKTLQSLKKMSQDSPWITLFHRESRHADTARFQVSVAGAQNDASLNIFAFGIAAKASITQVLFFKFRKDESTLQHNSATLTINPPMLSAIRGDIAQKITKYSKDFVAGLDV